VSFGRGGDGYQIDFVEKVTPVGEVRGGVLTGDLFRRLRVEIARSYELHPSFTRELRVVPRMMAAKASDTDRGRP
jgi:hypothetical protein